jgi:hypothetical protein
VGGYFTENRHVGFFCFFFFSGSHLEKSTYDVLLERILERTHDVWKGYK